MHALCSVMFCLCVLPVQPVLLFSCMICHDVCAHCSNPITICSGCSPKPNEILSQTCNPTISGSSHVPSQTFGRLSHEESLVQPTITYFSRHNCSPGQLRLSTQPWKQICSQFRQIPDGGVSHAKTHDRCLQILLMVMNTPDGAFIAGNLCVLRINWSHWISVNHMQWKSNETVAKTVVEAMVAIDEFGF